ncbi:MAG: cob(I)yrinic acid a,c-diamide adenosyltransferase [Syntrophales bacterium]|nr:cob(I)yrinic acid a,c-diamide adenosyltransferase [Syntrophales bacterium]
MKGKARIIIFTGNGKGKTTAALGMVLRASGHGLKSLVIQFVKNDDKTGELSACRNLPGVEIIQTGKGFVPPADAPSFSEHREAARKGLFLANQAVAEGRYGLVVLDEVCIAIVKGLLEEAAVMDCIQQAVPEVCIVLTGRGATDALIAHVDTVTEMREIKHGLQSGWSAQKGVEY